MVSHTRVAWMLHSSIIRCLLSTEHLLTDEERVAGPFVRAQAITPTSYKGNNCYKAKHPNGVE